MTEFRDLSRLPADQRYWDDLESRITGELSPLVRGVVRRPVWWTPLARRAWWLGGIAAAALFGLWLLPARTAAGTPAPAGFLRTPDSDSTLVAFVTAPAPPSVGVLVLTTTGGPR